MEPTAAEQAILSTLAYFDVFSYPLTPLEVWKWGYVDNTQPTTDNHHEVPRTGQAGSRLLLKEDRRRDNQQSPPEADPASPETLNTQSTTFGEVFSLLQTSTYLAERVESNEGFYFLRGSEDTVPIRKERYLMAERKYQHVRRALRAFRYLPFIRCIAVCNTLAYSNTRDEGDLDLLVITRPGRIWTARMLATSLAQLLGWRPDFRHTRDAVCLSFFLAEDAFDFRQIALEPDDRYLCYWLDQLVPLYGDASAVDSLRKENAWHAAHLPNAYGTFPARRRVVTDTFASKAVKGVLHTVHAGNFGNALERRYEQIQRRLLPDRLRDMANKDSRVVVSDGMLKFHDNDRRADFAELFAARLASVQ